MSRQKISRLLSRKQTKEKRKKQILLVRELKLQPKKSQKKRLERVFVEAKWFYNYLVEDVSRAFSNETYRLTEVPVKYPNGKEQKELSLLSSQMKQEIMKIIKSNLRALKTQKQAGTKVGKLSFVSKKSAIPLVQYGSTFKFVNKSKTRIHIQKLGRFRVLGGHALENFVEIAYAVLLKKSTGYYVKVIGYVFPEDFWKLRKNKEQFNVPVSIDFGIKNKLTLSNGITFDFNVKESRRLKALQKLLSATKSKKKRSIIRRRLRKEYERIKLARKDIHNKIIGILYRYETVVIQDEQIKSWQSGFFGKQIQHSAIGGITARIRKISESPATPKVEVVPANVRTTRVCSSCGAKVELGLKDRVFSCPHCGFVTDRDLNATYALLRYVGLDRPESKKLMPSERKVYKRNFFSLPSVRLTFLEESHTL